MADFLIFYYRAKMPDDPDVAARHKTAWHQWVEGLGDNLTGPSTLLGPTKKLSADGVSDATDNGLMGIVRITAASFDAALEIARTDPYLRLGATELGEIIQST